MGNYEEKLLNPKWQKKRLIIFNRDNFTCQNCGNTELTLHVHHFDYLGNNDPWDYPDDMLTTLCEICHNKEIERGKLERHFATTLKMRGFLYDDLVAFSSAIDTDILFRNALLTFIRNFKNG